MAKRVKTNPAEIEFVAPVAWRAKACRQADANGIPQTVYYVVDRECAWFEVSHSFWHDSQLVHDGKLNVAPLVTFLPSNYFN